MESPYDAGNGGQISADRHSVLVPVEIRGPSAEAGDKIDPVAARVAKLQEANPGFYVGSFGESTKKQIVGAFKDDLKKAGLYSIPLTLIILMLAFGALVAAGIPLLLGITAVLATFGLVALISQVLPMDDSVPAIILLIGLAVGVDYTMFYLKREREERARAAKRLRSRLRRQRPGARCSSRGARSSSQWRGCSSPATPASRPSLLRR